MTSIIVQATTASSEQSDSPRRHGGPEQDGSSADGAGGKEFLTRRREDAKAEDAPLLRVFAPSREAPLIPACSGPPCLRGQSSTTILSYALVWVLAVLFTSALGQENVTKPAPPAPALEVAHCRVLFIDRRLISAGGTGVIAEIVDEGARVTAETVLIQLQDRVPRAALAAAEARAESDVEIRLAEKATEAAKVDLDAVRAANALAPDAHPHVEVERLRVKHEQADLETERARQQLKIAQRERDQAEAELASTRIVAPIGGLVTKRLKAVGEGVQPADPILELVNTDRVRIEGYVPLEQLWKLQVGQTVRVQLDLGGERPLPVEQEVFTGQLGFVDVTVQSVAGTARIWAEVPNRKELLKDGLSARMTIDLSDPPPVEPQAPVRLKE